MERVVLPPHLAHFAHMDFAHIDFSHMERVVLPPHFAHFSHLDFSLMYISSSVNKYLFDIENNENLTSDSVCSICLDEFNENDNNNDNLTNLHKFCHLSCSDAHKFHHVCIKTWLEQNFVCPCCRTVPKEK